MNDILNETRLWYSDVSDKTINNKGKSKHLNSKTHKHKQKHDIVVKEYEVFNPVIDEVKYILNDTINVCTKQFFHSFENRCVYDIKFTNNSKNEELFLTISIGYMELESQFYGSSGKNRNARNNGFIFNQLLKLTTKNYSSL